MNKLLRFLHPLRQQKLLLLGLLVVIISASAAWWLFAKHSIPAARTETTTTPVKRTNSSAKSTDTYTSPPPPKSSPATAQTNGDKAVVAAQNSKDACQVLTLAAAQNVLGKNAQLQRSGSVTISETADTTVQSCSYSSGDRQLSVTVHYATSSLGTANNVVVFGSGKPPDAQDKAGYGQAAYWKPADSTFNILARNDWYILSIGGGDFSAIKPAADSIEKVL